MTYSIHSNLHIPLLLLCLLANGLLTSSCVHTPTTENQGEWILNNYLGTSYIYHNEKLQGAAPTEIIVKNASIWMMGSSSDNIEAELESRIEKIRKELKQDKLNYKQSNTLKRELFRLSRLRDLLSILKKPHIHSLGPNSTALADLKFFLNLPGRYPLRRVFKLPAQSNAISVSRIDNQIALGLSSGHVIYWKFTDPFTYPPLPAKGSPLSPAIISLQWNRRGDLLMVLRGLLSTNELNILRLLPNYPKETKVQFMPNFKQSQTQGLRFKWFADRPSFNQQNIVSYSPQTNTKIYGPNNNGNTLLKFQEIAFKAQSIAFASKSRLMALLNDSRGIRIWQIHSPRKLAPFKKPLEISGIRYAAFSPKSKIMAITRYPRKEKSVVLIWNYLTNNIIAEIPCNPYPGSSIAFNPRGDLLACGSSNGSVTLWNMKTFKLYDTLLAVNGKPYDVFDWQLSFGSKGKNLFGISNKYLYIWQRR